MKRIALIAMLLLLNIGRADAACTLYADYLGTASLGVSISYTDPYTYGGGVYTIPVGTTGKVCSLVAKMHKVAGSIASLHYVAKIWTMDGDSLGNNICTSAAVAGSDSWTPAAHGTPTFNFANCTGTKCSVTGCDWSYNPTVGITINAVEGNSSINIGHLDGVVYGAMPGYLATWHADKTIYPDESYPGAYSPRYAIYMDTEPPPPLKAAVIPNTGCATLPFTR